MRIRGQAAVLMATLLLVIALAVGANMALGKTITLFSEVSGQLVDADGLPQQGVTVRQSWTESPGQPEEVVETVTDPEGRFHFPIVQRRSLAAFLPGTPAIRQEIVAVRPEGLMTLWMHVRTSHRPGAEMGGGARLELICSIETQRGAGDRVWATCRLADEP